MGPLFAIAQLTWKASLRYRLFWLLSGGLLATVIFLPLMLKHDGTAYGFVQIVITYTLSVVFAILGLSTLWLSCGTLARDIEECQIQLLVTKPIARWQVWLGKWLGILMLNTVLITIAGVSIYSLTLWRLRKLPEAQQQMLREDFFISRANAKPMAPDIDAQLIAEFEKIPNRDQLTQRDQLDVMTNLLQKILIREEVVGAGREKAWMFNLGIDVHLRTTDDLYLRTKFYAATTNTSGTYLGAWAFTTPGSQTRDVTPALPLPSDSFQELKIPDVKPDAQGRLIVIYENHDNGSVLFPLDDGIEVLYRESSFPVNFIRAMAVLLAWLALLSTLGLAASSIASFPVAAFCSISALLVVFSSGTLSESVASQTVLAGNQEEFQYVRPVADAILLPMFKGILQIVEWIDVASPIDQLSSGRSVSWTVVVMAWVRVVGLIGGLIAATGIILLTRRELATASMQR